MATIVELKRGQEPRRDERYALVFASSTPPSQGAAIEVRDYGQTFFADDDEHDISVILKRAVIWADENNIAHVYVKRDRE